MFEKVMIAMIFNRWRETWKIQTKKRKGEQ